MRSFRKIFFLLLIIIFVNSCTRSILVDSIRNKNLFEICIAKNIHIPFDNFDTLILQIIRPELCATDIPNKEFLFRIYKPETDSVIYLKEVQNTILKPILVKREEASDGDTMTLQKKFIDLQTSWREDDYYLKNKVVLRMEGELISNGTIKISEAYHHFDSLITREKLFIYKAGKWDSKTIKQTLLTRDHNYNWAKSIH